MKTIDSLSLFQKTYLLVKTRLVSLQHKFNLSKINFNMIGSSTSQIKYPLFKFDDPLCLVQWKVKSD